MKVNDRQAPSGSPQPELPELAVSIRRQPPNEYRVQFAFDNDQAFPVGVVSDAVLPWRASPSSGEEAVRLHEWFFDDAHLREAWIAVRAQAARFRIRLDIAPAAVALHALPWELLYAPGSEATRALAANGDTPFSRYIATDLDIIPPVARMPLKLLVAIAAPTDLGAHDLAPINETTERENIEQALAEIGDEQLQIRFLAAPVTLDALRAELAHGYHMLHIVAHGAFDPARQTATLYLANAQNQTEEVNEDEFAQLAAASATPVRLVYLSSCESAAQGSGDAWHGLAPRMLAAGVPAVLAMREKVGMQAARTFAAAFYRNLLATGDMDRAGNHARASLRAADLPGGSTPVLVSRLVDNQLFTVPAADVQQPQFRADLINHVHQRWITDTLHASPDDSGQVTDRLLREVRAAVDPLGGVGAPAQEDRVIGADTTLIELFSEESGNALLILGQLGAGKTTLLIQLAASLLDRARRNNDEPVPVVFELNRWSPKQPSFQHWLIAELETRYHVPPNLGQDLLLQHDIALLLDGLGELPARARAACLDQINQFRVGPGGFVPIAVTCEARAYAELVAQLNLHNAIVIEPPVPMASAAGEVELEIRIDAVDAGAVSIALTVDRHRHYGDERRDLATLPKADAAPDPATGRKLFDWLLGTDAMRTEWLRARRQSRHRNISLQIAPALTDVMALPWELLQNSRDELGHVPLAADPDTTFYRFLPTDLIRSAPIYRRPLRILVAIIDGPELARFGHQAIDPHAERAFLASVFFGLDVEIAVDMIGDKGPLNLAGLNSALWRQSYDVLHLIGHGAYNEEEHIGALLMTRSEGDRVAPVTATQLADMLASLSRDMPHWVVLSHPRGATQASAPAWRAITQACLNVGVHALCMEQSLLTPTGAALQSEIDDDEAYRYYRTFYQTLTDSKAFDQAHNAANVAMLTADGGPPPALAVLPIALFSRTRDMRVVLPVRPTPEVQDPERRQKLVLLNRVRNNWVEGILNPSLNGLALIEVPRMAASEAVATSATQVVNAQQPILNIFRQADGALLILGAPGSGKTFILLELTRDLIAEAQENPAAAIPVVFNLSSWRNIETDLTDWMVRELSAMYYIPERYSRGWIEKDQILPLLDGFDEVRAASRPTCVEAINAFRQQHPQGDLVVCSRIAEYEELVQEGEADYRLTLNAAMRLLPLSRAQIDDYLHVAGPALAALRTVITEDKTLFELAQTPLMLNVMVVAYADFEEAELRGFDSVEERRQHLFECYVDRAFHPIGARPRHLYPELRTKRWLIWLARQMNWHGQSIFLVENIQPSWLEQKRSLWTYVLGSRLAVGLIGGLIGGIIISFGLIFSDIQWLNQHPWVEYSMADIVRSSFWRGILEGGFGGLLGGLIMGLIDVASFSQRQGERTYLPNPTTRQSAIRSIWVGMTIWALVTLLFAVVFGGMERFDLINWFYCFGEEDNIAAEYVWWRCSVGHLSEGVQVGLLVALSFITIFRTAENRQDPKDDIRTTEYLHWSGEKAREGGLHGLGRGVLVGIILIVIDLLGVMDDTPFRKTFPDEFFVPLIFSITIFISIVFGVMRNGLRGSLLESDTSVPNQGIHLSLKNALFIGLSYGLSFGLIGALVGALLGIFGGHIGVTSLIFGSYGVFFGLLAAIWYGGLDILKHYWLRSTLWRAEGAPPVHRYVPFFDNAAGLVLLRKAGGGYLFFHRLLQDYFAQLTPEDEFEDEFKEQSPSRITRPDEHES